MSALELLKFFGAPGSVGFLAASCVLALLLRYVWPRRPAVARAWIVIVAALYLGLGLPVVADGLAQRLPALEPEAGRGIQTLVVLDGDNRLGRLAAALRIWESAGPRLLIVSGERWLVDALLEAGVPRDRIVHDISASTTRAQIEWLAPLASDPRFECVGVIASRVQMPRVDALVRAQGVQVALISSPVDTEPPTTGWRRFVPTYSALRVSRDALYEHVALFYYRRRGWISDGPLSSRKDSRPHYGLCK